MIKPSNVCEHDHTKRVRLPQYEEHLLGTSVVLIDSVEADVCTRCGEQVAVCIPNQDSLVHAVALVRVENIQKKLSPKEIRFIRKALGFSSKEMSTHMGVSAEHYSRWESEEKNQPFTYQNEKLFRMIAQAVLSRKVAGILADPEKVALSTYSCVWESCCEDPLIFQRILVRREGSRDVEYDWGLRDQRKRA